MNILFICKYNRFRSKVAEAYFNKNRPEHHKAKSAGIVPGIPIYKDIIYDCMKSGIEITGHPIGINHKMLMWSDVIIIISDNIPKYLFLEEIKNDKKRAIKWSIKDAKTRNQRSLIIKKICKKIDVLIKELK